MKKNVLAKVFVLTAVALLALACTKDNSNEKKVAVLLPDASIIDRWTTDKANLETAMAKYGFNTTFYVAPETEAGAAQQVEQLREAIQVGARFIVLTSIDYKKINESGLLAKHPEVKVVCHDRFVLDNPNIAYISSTDTKEIGRMQALFLLNHFHASGATSMTIEFLEGPETDVNAKDFFEGAYDYLKKYIDSGQLVVKSGKTTYAQVKSDSWLIADGKKAMQDRLASYGAGERPDMILAANDNLAEGAIEALGLAGITDMPVITGQDNTAMAMSNIKHGKQAMTIDKNLQDMAYNTAMIINSLIANAPVQTSQSISGIPVLYSKVTLKTVDSY
ncbi:MAG: substrate-binding domain-containing protein [Bacteroidales bacterium]|jgi:putative multiple sugar transport system substrate-binding protein|nr:substrate-binding domain-containing protein [Bacteroidales bacterium]MDY6443597.1 substrate-binding domain-containing protein [Bacteroidales bacterium]